MVMMGRGSGAVDATVDTDSESGVMWLVERGLYSSWMHLLFRKILQLS